MCCDGSNGNICTCGDGPKEHSHDHTHGDHDHDHNHSHGDHTHEHTHEHAHGDNNHKHSHEHADGNHTHNHTHSVAASKCDSGQCGCSGGCDCAPPASDKWEPKIIAFLCNWCSYAGADLAGTSRLQYPPNIRVIRVPCSGRINPLYIIKALLEGADGVMVSGCHPGDCHYLSGNLFARRRFTVLKKLLTTVGIDPDRVQFTWVSASEGPRFAQVITEVTESIRKTGPNNTLGSSSERFAQKATNLIKKEGVLQ